MSKSQSSNSNMDPQKHPQSELFWEYYNLGKKMASSDISQSIKSYQMALEIDENYYWTYFELGKVLTEKGDLREAKRNFSKMEELYPGYCFTYYYLGNIAFQEKEYDVAKEFYIKSVERGLLDNNSEGSTQDVLELAKVKESSNYLAYCSLGEIALQRNFLKFAQAFYEKAVKLQPTSSKPYIKLAQIALARSNQDSAIKYYFTGAWNLMFEKKLSDAEATYRKILELNPNDEQTYYQLANVSKRRNKPQKACEMYRQAICVKPDFIDAHNSLGDILTDIGQYRKAYNCYRNALKYEILNSKPHLYSKISKFHQKPSDPNFMIIGFAKCGTTSLHQYLIKHPKILPTAKKEIMFFSESYENGIPWYLSHFPSLPDDEGFITGEASAHYIDHPHACKRLVENFPNLKLIILIRDPIERTISDYQMLARYRLETRPFAEAITAEIKRIEATQDFFFSEATLSQASSFIASSVYVMHIQRWLSVFPRNQILILKTENLSSQPEAVLDNIFDFLGVDSFKLDEYPRYNTGNYASTLDAEVYETLQNYFAPYNSQLEELLAQQTNYHSLSD